MNDDVIVELSQNIIEISNRLTRMEERMESVPHDIHNEHHEYMDVIIEKEKYKRDFWRRVSEKLATAGIIGSLSLIGAVIWFGIKQYLGK